MPLHLRMLIVIWVISIAVGVWGTCVCRNRGRFGMRWLLVLMFVLGACSWLIRDGFPNLHDGWQLNVPARAWLWIFSYSLVPFSIACIATSLRLPAPQSPPRRLTRETWHRPSAHASLLPPWMLATIVYQVLFSAALVPGLYFFAIDDYGMTPDRLGLIAGTLHAGVAVFALVCMWNDVLHGRFRSSAHVLCCVYVAVTLAMQGYALYSCFHVVRRY